MITPPAIEIPAPQPANTVLKIAPGHESLLPAGVGGMIETAIASGDPKVVETVFRLARSAHPAAAAELDTLERQWSATQRSAVAPAVAPLRGKPSPVWQTQVELGASRATGRTSYLGAIGSVLVEGEGTHWRQKFQARYEFQQGRNVADVERASASWQPSYKFDDQLYLYGLSQIESDPAQRLHARYTAGGGLGYTVVKSETAKLDLEGGPALRHVDQVADRTLTSLSARASINLRWALLPTLELNQTSALFLEGDHRSASALTRLDAQLVGPLKARLSYDVRYESRFSSGSHIDTLSRATLVLSF